MVLSPLSPFCVVSALKAETAVWYHDVPVPLPTEIGTFALSGALLAVAHTLMIEAFRRGEATLVAPFKYSSLLWATIFGFVIFGELPSLWTLAGAAIIVKAGLYVFHREAHTNRVP